MTEPIGPASRIASHSGPGARSALASDGGIVTVRPATAGDLPGLAALGARFAQAGPGPHTTGGPALPLTFVALDGTGLIGAASWLRTDSSGRTATVAVAVAGPHRNRGIGTLLLDRIADHAGDRGVTRLIGGYEPPAHEDGRARESARDAREDIAERSPLRRVLAPRAVAVVGAGQQRGGTGHEILRALRDYDFRGRLYAVNPAGRTLCGIPTRRAVADLPAPIDLLVIAVPAGEVAGVLADAGPLGARAAILMDPGPTARQRQQIREAARGSGIRLLGPACLGILNTDPAVRLNAGLAPARPPTGGLALAARSGELGIALLADAARDHCGVSTLVALGEESDLTGADLLAYWFDDPATRAVALSPEAFADLGRFARAARALGRRKPVLADTGASPRAADDLLAQAGVIRTTSLHETLDAARMLVDQPLPAGSRMAIVGNAGGLTSLAARTARAHGFHVVPSGGALHTGAGLDSPPARIADVAESVANSGAADSLLLLLVSTRANVVAATVAALAPVLDGHPGLPAAAVITGGSIAFHRLGRRNVPIYREAEQAIRALAHARDYAAWRREPLDAPPDPGGVRSGDGRALIRQALRAGSSRVARRVVVDILAAYGIETLSAVPAESGVAAVAAAERAGYPVIVKSTGETRSGLTGPAAVHDAFTAISRAHRIVVQRQVSAPVELAVSVSLDPATGPAIALEAAGVNGPAGDRVTNLLPLTGRDARRMSLALRCAPLLDTPALEDLLVRVAGLAADLPEAARLDLRPIFGGKDGLVVADADLRLATVRAGQQTCGPGRTTDAPPTRNGRSSLVGTGPEA